MIVPTLDAERLAVLCPRPPRFRSPGESADHRLRVDRRDSQPSARRRVEVHLVARANFNHGGTRQMAAELLLDAEILVYMTQDAILAGHTLSGCLKTRREALHAVGAGANATSISAYSIVVSRGYLRSLGGQVEKVSAS